MILTDEQYGDALQLSRVVVGPVTGHCPNSMTACTVFDSGIAIYLPTDDPDLLLHEICHVYRLVFMRIPADQEINHIGWLIVTP